LHSFLHESESFIKPDHTCIAFPNAELDPGKAAGPSFLQSFAQQSRADAATAKLCQHPDSQDAGVRPDGPVNS
jgi:hypothetical protein